jgi:F0F1-type ATP synthase membrane subunit c/vacuolar-type H+-ATPase subunit K
VPTVTRYLIHLVRVFCRPKARRPMKTHVLFGAVIGTGLFFFALFIAFVWFTDPLAAYLP